MRAQHFASIAIAVLFSLSTGAQVPLSPTQVPGVTTPGAQRQQPQDGGRQPLMSPIGKVPQTQPQVQVLNGVLMGISDRDASTIP